MPYGPHAADDRARMLEAIGIGSVDALFEDIPEALRSAPLALGEPIAMAYVATAHANPGTMLDIEIRGSRVAAEVVPLPFYKRPA